jgi:flavin reductase (DIM6/NTAB) family NADH-FMN oxidoreductase RutF
MIEMSTRASQSNRDDPFAHAQPSGSEVTTASYRDAMRHLPGGVSVITVGHGEERTGFTATSVSSLSIDPPTILVSVNRGSSSYQALLRSRLFGVNVLSTRHRDVAERFAGRDGAKGADRYREANWVSLVTGAALLADAVVAFDCELEELIERHSHAIVIGCVRGVRLNGGSNSLVYWRGGYEHLGWTDEEVSRSVGLAPIEARTQSGPEPLVRPTIDSSKRQTPMWTPRPRADGS